MKLIVLQLILITVLDSFAVGPNILVIVTDDQGYGDLSIHGNTILETPNLDRLAEKSVRLENFHVAPCCAPTRASLMTGRNHHEAGVWGVHWARDYMHLDEVTIAEVLRDAGYDTGMIGKWHSGRAGAWLPWNRGFNEAWVSELYNHKDTRISHNGRLLETSGYADRVLTDIAIDFIGQERSDQPWFLHMAYMTPHAPWVAPEEYIEKYRQKGCSDLFALLNGMLDHLDEQIGRLLKSVDPKDTLVVFMSDNGPIHQSEVAGELSAEEAALRNPARMRGVKGNIWENATRVPCFIRWEGEWTPAQVPALTDVTDLFPTLLEVVGIESIGGDKPLHGRSLLPLLAGEKKEWSIPRELYKPYWMPFWNEGWSNEGAVDIRNIQYDNQLNAFYSEPYKLVKFRGRRPEMYDLGSNHGETEDIRKQQPDLGTTMEKSMRAAYEAMVDSGRCWQQPRFHIGHPEYDRYDTVGEILSGSVIPFCSSVRDEGNVVAKSHDSRGWKRAGDAQTVLVEVVASGNYEVFVDARRFSENTRVRMDIGASNLESILPNGRGEIAIGHIELSTGDQDLRFSILDAPATDKDVIEQLKTIRFKRDDA